MRTTNLLPTRCKKIGWFLLVPSALFGLYTVAYDWEPALFDAVVPGFFTEEILESKEYVGWIENNLFNELWGILSIIGGLMVAFSKVREEDEYITKIRLEALVWAVYWNYGILILGFILVYDLSFLWVMIFNMYTVLLFFIAKFNWSLLQLRKANSYEE